MDGAMAQQQQRMMNMLQVRLDELSAKNEAENADGWA